MDMLAVLISVTGCSGIGVSCQKKHLKIEELPCNCK